MVERRISLSGLSLWGVLLGCGIASSALTGLAGALTALPALVAALTLGRRMGGDSGH